MVKFIYISLYNKLLFTGSWHIKGVFLIDFTLEGLLILWFGTYFYTYNLVDFFKQLKFVNFPQYRGGDERAVLLSTVYFLIGLLVFGALKY